MKEIKAGEPISIGIKYRQDKRGISRKESGKRIIRMIAMIYSHGWIKDSCGEPWKAKRTSAGIVAVALVALMLTGCSSFPSVVFDEPIQSPQHEEVQEAKNAPLIRALTDSGCEISSYTAKGRLREVTIKCVRK